MPQSTSASHAASDRTQPLKRVHEPGDHPHTDDMDADDGTQDTVYLAFETSAVPLAPNPQAGGDTAAVATQDDLAQLMQAQALELAATRAELARHERERNELQRMLSLRERWLDELRRELEAAQEAQRLLAAQLADAREKAAALEARVRQQAEQITVLEAQAAERMSATAFAHGSSRGYPARSSEPLKIANPSRLEPLDDDGPPISLNRRVMTIGRTRDNDICIASVLVSRDHARLLVSEEGVVLYDIGSINGSFVNNEPVKRHALRDGDIVRFADRKYRFSA